MTQNEQALFEFVCDLRWKIAALEQRMNDHVDDWKVNDETERDIEELKGKMI